MDSFSRMGGGRTKGAANYQENYLNIPELDFTNSQGILNSSKRPGGKRIKIQGVMISKFTLIVMNHIIRERL